MRLLCGMKTLLTCLTILFVSLNSWATNPTTGEASYVSLSGQIIDMQNNEALIGASITIMETNQVIYSDFDGKFEFSNLPVGTYTIKISMVSFEDVVVKNLNMNQALELDLALHSK